MSVPDELEAICAAAFASMRAGDYLAAKIGFMEITARRATVPDVERSLGGAGRQSIRWRDLDLNSLITQCDKMLAAASHASSGPFVQIPVTYARPASSDDYT